MNSTSSDGQHGISISFLLPHLEQKLLNDCSWYPIFTRYKVSHHNRKVFGKESLALIVSISTSTVIMHRFLKLLDHFLSGSWRRTLSVWGICVVVPKAVQPIILKELHQNNPQKGSIIIWIRCHGRESQTQGCSGATGGAYFTAWQDNMSHFFVESQLPNMAPCNSLHPGHPG